VCLSPGENLEGGGYRGKKKKPNQAVAIISYDDRKR
jgi:hypothetical protein